MSRHATLYCAHGKQLHYPWPPPTLRHAHADTHAQTIRFPWDHRSSSSGIQQHPGDNSIQSDTYAHSTPLNISPPHESAIVGSFHLLLLLLPDCQSTGVAADTSPVCVCLFHILIPERANTAEQHPHTYTHTNTTNLWHTRRSQWSAGQCRRNYIYIFVLDDCDTNTSTATATANGPNEHTLSQ